MELVSYDAGGVGANRAPCEARVVWQAIGKRGMAPCRTLLVCGLALLAPAAWAQEPPPPQTSGVPIPDGQVAMAIGELDRLVEDMRARTGIPGVAVAVVRGRRRRLRQGLRPARGGQARAGRRGHGVPARLGVEVGRGDGGRARGRRRQGWVAQPDGGASALVRARRPGRDRDADRRRSLRPPLGPARPRGRRARGSRLRPAPGAGAAAAGAAAGAFATTTTTRISA